MPELADGGLFGGDDGQGGWAPLAVATPTGTGGTQIAWVYGDHLGVPLLAMDAGGQTLALSGFAVQGFPGQRRTLPDHYYIRHRDYDPSTGRYIQADPIGLAGGASPYSYAMNNPLRYTDPTGEFVPVAIIGSIALGVGTELIFQGADNWYNGRNIWDPDCYDWGEVALSGGMGAFGGAWVKGMVRMTPGSMVWNNVSRRIRKAENMIRGPDDLHHWLVPQRFYKGKAWAERIFNRPWNLNRVERGFHRRLHKTNVVFRTIRGAPGPVQGGAAFGSAGAAGELADGEWE